MGCAVPQGIVCSRIAILGLAVPYAAVDLKKLKTLCMRCIEKLDLDLPVAL